MPKEQRVNRRMKFAQNLLYKIAPIKKKPEEITAANNDGGGAAGGSPL